MAVITLPLPLQSIGRGLTDAEKRMVDGVLVLAQLTTIKFE